MIKAEHKGMVYVNHKGVTLGEGDPLVVAAELNAKQRHNQKPKTPRHIELGHDGKPLRRHMGWSVTGFRPERVEEVRRQHSIRQEGRADPEVFSSEAWMTRNAPTQISKRPYSLESAAKVAAQLAERDGWLHVRIFEVIK